MKRVCLILVLVPFFLAEPVVAQKENNVWVFGRNLGLDFNSGTAVAISTNIATAESCASVCDASGALLFYSDGVGVYDKTFSLMPNGSDLKGDESTAQGVVISPVAGEPGKYFLFTLESGNRSGKLHYSLIDLSLNGGKGDIVPGFKNRLLGKGMNENMVLAASCTNTWLITHAANGPIFYSWPLTSSAITPVAVETTTPGKSGHIYTIANMKMSIDYRNLYMGNAYLERFDFNTQTGKLSGYQLIDTIDSYCLEISAGNSKLYCGGNGGGVLYQYDLSLLPDVAALRSSKTSIGYSNLSLRRGPDQKIYTNRYIAPGEISRINKPDLAGAACDYEIDIPALKGAGSFYLQFGNNTIPPNRNSLIDTVYSRTDTLICSAQKAVFSKDASYREMVWNDGNTAYERVLDKTGTYWRRYARDCTVFVDTIVVIGLSQPDTVARKALDTMVCFLPEIQLKTTISSDKYTWNDGATGSEKVFSNPGTYWVAALNHDQYCEFNIDSFSVSFTDFEIALNDTFLCRGEEATLDAGTTGATAYLWNNGTAQSTIQANNEGKFWVSVSKGTCSKTDTIQVSSRSFDLDLGKDLDLCNGSRILLDPKVPEAKYTWQDGSSNSSYYATDSGLYSVVVTKNGCSEKGSVTIRYMHCVECVSMPNAFTPNGDGRNDVFRILAHCPALQYELLIVDRYGTVVFSSKQISDSWDGTFKGQPLELGVYYYLVKASFDRGQDVREEIFKGDISLLR